MTDGLRWFLVLLMALLGLLITLRRPRGLFGPSPNRSTGPGLLVVALGFAVGAVSREVVWRLVSAVLTMGGVLMMWAAIRRDGESEQEP